MTSRIPAPVRVQLSSAPPRNKLRKSPKPRSSSETTSDSSDEDYDSPVSPVSRVNSPFSFSSKSSHSSTSTTRTRRTALPHHARHTSLDQEGSWRRALPAFPGRKPPVLRLALPKSGSRPGVKPNLETIPGSPCLTTTYKQTESFSSLTDSDTSPTAPSFTIPTDAAIRREKMKRLTKKLGEGVPVHLVFPPEEREDEDDIVGRGVVVDISSRFSPSTPSSISTNFTSPMRSASSLSPLVPTPSPTSSESSCTSSSGFGRSFFRHEPEFQVLRKTKFAEKPLPPTPTAPGKGFTGRFIVHYEGAGEHGRTGSETFDGLKCASMGHSRQSSRSSSYSSRLESVQE